MDCEEKYNIFLKKQNNFECKCELSSDNCFLGVWRQLIFVNASLHLLTITVIPCSLQNMAVEQRTILSSNMAA